MFNSAMGTSLAGLHRKERKLAFGASRADRVTVCAPAVHCMPAVNSAFCRRRRFLAAEDWDPRMLAGIVEADETYMLERSKGERRLDREARRGGGKTCWRGLLSEQVLELDAAWLNSASRPDHRETCKE